ncbi:hypothetical protein [Lacipirellula limnantheis]|uniref:Uncharacterized protein n=1 Tax=Lacipirellula limnantheis TaxID=2528024 RepID=A0A517U0I7_9BACT|nr:hypothetical protein [Lacipirellula limnantheis]QDT74139.1 hypothetical protein I41_33340 [Lacipirellula limnantheis]
MLSPRNAAPAAPPRWQSIATVLIILHLFCLAIGVAINVGGGKSLVGQSLRNVPLARQYLRGIMMDLAYDFHLAGAEDDDGVHRLQLLKANAPPNDPGAVLAELPDDGNQLRIRRQRYQQLAFHVSFFDNLFAENNDLRTKLPLQVAERWVAAEGLPTDSYLLRCVKIPSKRLPRAIEADITYAYVMREGGLRQQVVEKPAPEPINIFMVWDPNEGHYQGAREAALGQRALVAGSTAAKATSDAK